MDTEAACVVAWHAEEVGDTTTITTDHTTMTIEITIVTITHDTITITVTIEIVATTMVGGTGEKDEKRMNELIMVREIEERKRTTERQLKKTIGPKHRVITREVVTTMTITTQITDKITTETNATDNDNTNWVNLTKFQHHLNKSTPKFSQIIQ